jgi:DNA-binding response OmpR family regulator
MARSLVPGRFNSAVVRADLGELEARLSDGGHWQVKVRAVGEAEWRLLCVGDLGGQVLAPTPPDPPATINIGPLSIDFVRRRVAVEGVDQPLRPREFDLLALLAAEPTRLFTKEEILCEVWGYPEGAGASTRTIESHISAARCKLRQAGVEGIIVNYRGVGYKFCDGAAIDVGSSASAGLAP